MSHYQESMFHCYYLYLFYCFKLPYSHHGKLHHNGRKDTSNKREHKIKLRFYLKKPQNKAYHFEDSEKTITFAALSR